MKTRCILPLIFGIVSTAITACGEGDIDIEEKEIESKNTPGTAEIHFTFKRGIEDPKIEQAECSVEILKKNFATPETAVLFDSTFAISLADMPTVMAFSKRVSLESIERERLVARIAYQLGSNGIAMTQSWECPSSGSGELELSIAVEELLGE